MNALPTERRRMTDKEMLELAEIVVRVWWREIGKVMFLAVVLGLLIGLASLVFA